MAALYLNSIYDRYQRCNPVQLTVGFLGDTGQNTTDDTSTISSSPVRYTVCLYLSVSIKVLDGDAQLGISPAWMHPQQKRAEEMAALGTCYTDFPAF